ncbi:MAG: sigma-70 family RNA polymerase sigma factor [Polyangiaceae bacterium]|nr:sigma-70 family RNA polymerase sigma factor [Polyangiaceae bacterium]
MREEPLESRVRAVLLAHDADAAVVLTLEELGAEVLGFLVARQKSRAEAEDAFSLACERLWQSFDQFDWRCSLRSWFYRLARNAAVDLIRQRGVVGRGAVPLSQAPELQELAARIRTATASHYASERKQEVMALREQLSEEDRELLTLRFERGMSWDEVVEVISGALPADARTKEAARLRKRAQLARDRLQKLARERGLLPNE